MSNSDLMPYCEACRLSKLDSDRMGRQSGAQQPKKHEPKPKSRRGGTPTTDAKSRNGEVPSSRNSAPADVKRRPAVPDDGKTLKTCPICMEDKHKSVCWRREACGCVACFDDLFMHFSTSLDQKGNLPRCICNEVLTGVEYTKFLEACTAHKIARLSAPQDKKAFVEQTKCLHEKFLKLSQRIDVNALTGGVACPGVDCKMVVVRRADNIAECVVCSECGNDHCSLCRSHPFHYTIGCKDVAKVRASYADWVARGRRAYLERMAALDDDYKRKLADFNAERARHQGETKRLQAIAERFKQDEAWKAANCRLCPSCERVIEKIDGCNAMVCGRNYHGGGTQDGCGHNFNWTAAPPYQGADVKARQIEFKKLKPQAAVHKWTEANGEPTLCEICKSQVAGIKLQCVNCPFFVCCAACEPGALGHRETPAGHTQQHVFQLFEPPTTV
jgi:hypothetical protein